MKITISGASGLVGTALVERLRAAGHHVTRLVRGEPAAGTTDTRWDPQAGRLPAGSIDGADAVINLSGAGIADHRWSDDYKRELLDSRVRTTELLATTISAAERKPTVFVSGSAIGYYGPRGDETLDETATAGSTFLAGVCVQWEQAASPATEAGVRTVTVRTGIVLSADGGALKKQLPLFKVGLGGRFGSGDQWQSWISIDDEVGALEHLLTSSVSGPVNLTAPSPVTNSEFTTTLAHVLKRPAIIPVPSFGPKLLLGSELTEALLLTGQRVVPAKLLADGYQFQHTTLEAALRTLLRR